MAVILITHDLGIVAETADRVAVMYAGQVVESCDVRAAFRRPLHPYTAGLQASLPKLGVKQDALRVIPGNVPNPARFPRRLPLSPSMPGLPVPLCLTTRRSDDRGPSLSRCFRSDEIAAGAAQSGTGEQTPR